MKEIDIEKETYEAPTILVVGMNVEGVICVSTRDYNWHYPEEE